MFLVMDDIFLREYDFYIMYQEAKKMAMLKCGIVLCWFSFSMNKLRGFSLITASVEFYAMQFPIVLISILVCRNYFEEI